MDALVCVRVVVLDIPLAGKKRYLETHFGKAREQVLAMRLDPPLDIGDAARAEDRYPYRAICDVFVHKKAISPVLRGTAGCGPANKKSLVNVIARVSSVQCAAIRDIRYHKLHNCV